MRDGAGASRRARGAEVEVRADGAGEPALVVPNKGRVLQARRVGRRKLFDGRARKVFLGWFAGTGNLSWAARKAGVHYRTVLRHRMEDAGFREDYDLAEAQSVPRLRAWLAQAREEAEDGVAPDEAGLDALAAEAGEASGDGAADHEDAAGGAGLDDADAEADEDGLAPGGDTGPENLSVEQAMRIVEAWEKRQGRGPGGSGPAGAAYSGGRAPTVASNAEVRESLVTRLRQFGIRVLGERAANGEATAIGAAAEGRAGPEASVGGPADSGEGQGKRGDGA